MERFPVRDRLESPGHLPGQHQRHLVRLRPAGAEENAGHPFRSNRDELLCRSHGNLVRIAPRAEREPGVELPANGLHDLRMVESRVMDAVSVKIQIAAPVGVDDIGPLDGGNRVHHRRGEALV